MQKKKLLSIGGLVIILAVIFFLAGRSFIVTEEKIQKQTRFLMDTYCTIQAVGPKKVVNRAISLALDRMEEIDKKFNVLDPNSPLYEFNNKNIPTTDQEILDLLKIAQQVSKESIGAFDITIYPLITLWGFYGDSPALPGKQKISEYLKKIGYKKLFIKNGKLTKLKEDIKIDLGGIAKGYAVSEAIKVLKEEGIKSALVDAGGDIYALGKLKGKDWKVGIRNPRGEGVIGVIEVSDLAVVTSGDYERFFEKDGVKYHHILNPKTGYPARGLTSVTVISPDPVFADAWSTALFVMGKEKGLELVEKTPDTETLMVTTEGEILYSSGLKENLEIISKGGKK
ncbi:MAG: FAD:protein FMN transferase [bacterium]